MVIVDHDNRVRMMLIFLSDVDIMSFLQLTLFKLKLLNKVSELHRPNLHQCIDYRRDFEFSILKLRRFTVRVQFYLTLKTRRCLILLNEFDLLIQRQLEFKSFL
jgi:hypothetical protein